MGSVYHVAHLGGDSVQCILCMLNSLGSCVGYTMWNSLLKMLCNAPHLFMPSSSCGLFKIQDVSPVYNRGLGGESPKLRAYASESTFRLPGSVGMF